eukprot:Em0030g21a
MNQIPVRFFVKQLKDQWEIVLTGFSFGGMLACFVAASIWNSSVISPEEFKHRVICITFGQPLIGIPLVEDIINTSHEFRESIHLIFDQTDVIPRLLRFTSSTKAQLGSCISANHCFSFSEDAGKNRKVSSESVVIDSKTLALKDLQNALRVAVPVAARQDGGSPLLKASCYVVSPDRQLVMVEKDKTFDDLSYFSPSSVDDLNDTLFKQIYPCTLRQAQLAKHTPTEVIQLAYLCAMLEQPSGRNSKRNHSERLKTTIKFLEEAVNVVPVESIFYAIAYGDQDVALQCSSALEQHVARPNSHQSNKIITPQPPMLPVCTATVQNNLTIPIPPRDEDSLSACPNVVEYLRKFADDIYAHGCSKIAQKKKLAYMCGLNINEVYQTSSTSDHESVLSSPTRVLSDARKKLSQLVKLACEESKGFPLKQSSEQSSPSPSSFHNLEMLQTINKVRGQDLNLCTTLLSAFMEQQIRIPLINSSALETASALSTSAAPIALGVWALFSLNYGDIKEMLGSLRGKPLMVDITNYIMGVFNTPLKMEDARYAGKLQFLLQGMGETISCNSQYVSYSLEQQLVQLYEKRLKTSISLSTDLDNIIAKWDTIFQGDALSLVAKPHRPLIARWLKWAFMIHQLREKKIHTQSARSWLTELESEKEAVPILVCLTHADRLYAEIMAQDNKSQDKLELRKRYIRSELTFIKERLGHSPSRDVDFYSFSQEPDSTLNNEQGRKVLEDVGIHGVNDVGVWIVEKLKTQLDQPNLAIKLQEHFQKTSQVRWYSNNIMTKSCLSSGIKDMSALAAETRKLHSNGPKCQELGWSCVPLAVETYGNWGKQAHDTFSRLASFLAIHQSSPKAVVVAEIYGRLNVVLVRSIARAILARELPPS